LGFALFALACLLQIIALPLSWVDILSPEKARLFVEGWDVAIGGERTDYGMLPLSLDASATADRGLRWLTIFVAALVAGAHAQSRHGWHDLLRLLTLAGLVVLAVGVLQVVAGTEKVGFLYAPEDALKPFTTFINPNHGAVFYGLSTIAAIGLAVRTVKSRPIECSLASLAALLLAWATWTQDSNATNIAFVTALFAQVGFSLQVLRKRGVTSGAPARLAGVLAPVVPVVMAVIVLLAFQFEWSSAVDTLRQTSTGQWLFEESQVRLELLRAALETSRDFAWTGIGAGATERALAGYLDWGILPIGVVPTIENEPVEWILQYGWPIALAATAMLLGYGWLLIRGQRRRRKLRYSVGLSAAIFLGMVAQFHFPFFALGIAIPAVVLLQGSVSGALAEQSEHMWASFRLSSRRWLWLGVGGVALLIVVFAWAHRHYAVELGGASDTEVSQDDVARRLTLIPADGHLFAAYALQIEGADQQESKSAALMAHAFELEPTPQMKLLQARTLWHAGRQEAAIDAYQHAFSARYPSVWNDWIRELLVGVVEQPVPIADALEQASVQQWTVAAKELRRRGGYQAVIEFATRLVELHPNRYETYRMVIEANTRMRRFELAKLWARLLISKGLEGPGGRQPVGYQLFAEVLRASGRQDAARELALRTYEDPSYHDEELGSLIVKLRTLPPREASPLEHRALQSYRREYCSAPDSPSRKRLCWTAEGWLAEKDGNMETARYAYERLERKLGRTDEIARFYARNGMCVELEELRRRLTTASDRHTPTLQKIDGLQQQCADNSD
jgi:tetratricopeptide (TPR) repeat protein